ncbi:unnamed protein product, partial [Gongylonema pulchrum]|uniref:CPG4 domain-containing protein n=1 Tax=Gongylonema pulchrum TaxID=637853 RepID=A0A183ES23_9BILA
ISFDQVITRACQRDPTLRYCIEARDRNITNASGGRSQYASKNTGRILPEDDPGSRVFNRLLADPVAEKEVFRSSTRELPLHEASSASTETNDPFCDEDEDRYNHYCHDVIERSSSTQQELFKYCIDYEIKCPHKTVNKKNTGATRAYTMVPKLLEVSSVTSPYSDSTGSVRYLCNDIWDIALTR